MKMNRTRKVACCVGSALVVVLALIAAHKRNSETIWPHFDEHAPRDGKPHYVIEFRNGRDYGYRTGNIVPLRVSLKVPAGTEVDLDSVALTQTDAKGKKDLEITHRESFSQTTAEGINYIRLDLNLQAFVYRPTKWTTAVTINYRTADDGRVKTLVMDSTSSGLPVKGGSIAVFNSKTYDGRKSKHPMEPVVEPVHGSHGLWTLARIVVGWLGMLVTGTYLFLTRKQKGPKVKAEKPPDPWAGVDSSWQAIKSGNRSKQAFDQLALAVRAFFNVGTRSAAELYGLGTAQDANVATILEVCHEAGWGVEPISDERLEPAAQALTNLTPPGRAAN